MVRVLVVGMDLIGERGVFARLTQAAAAADAVVPARDLDACDVLVVGDSPGLRQTVSRVLHRRPTLDVLVRAADGVLHQMGAPADTRSEAARLASLLARHPRSAAAELPRAIDLLATGAKPVTRLLRAAQRARSGHLVMAIETVPMALLDFAADQVVPLRTAAHDGTQWPDCLGEDFDRASLYACPSGLPERLAGQPRQPLRPLLWQLASASTHWRDLDARLERHARIALLRWPDFRVLAHRPEAFRLCSLLLKRASTLDECTELLQIGRGDVLAFAHPAYLCGYAQIDAGEHIAQPALPGRGEGSLLARMWRGMRAMGAH